MTGERLSTQQRAMLADLAKDGAFTPHPHERRRADGLASRGLIVWQNGGTVQITDAGREAIRLPQEAR